ncbi:hypothetical protein IM792_20645 [Mucilaginibacter sp. JRF]|uniref:hypothetical protein n=1 Tax=Mucilaginibacter sp. JRF TaxID=2780088 RepID=UPI00187EB52E|nr:hypothetical protein [Mucilaginibacter sp. JRF]MBE9586870.1 hypothetical protein [Mucilaginibacter sp. JRF]
MKKIAFIILFSAVFGYVKAQNTALIMPQVKTFDQQRNDRLFHVDSLNAKKYRDGILRVEVKPSDIIIQSRMPVSKPQGFNSKTPVAGKGSSTAGYNMPIKRVQIINPDTARRAKVNP